MIHRAPTRDALTEVLKGMLFDGQGYIGYLLLGDSSPCGRASTRDAPTEVLKGMLFDGQGYIGYLFLGDSSPCVFGMTQVEGMSR